MSVAIINLRFWLARKLIGKHAAAINCGMKDVPDGFMAWSANKGFFFCTKGDPR